MYNEYEVGDLVRYDLDVTISGTHVDPSYVSLSVRRPDNVIENYIYGQTGTLIRENTGIFYLQRLAHLPGQWGYRWFCSGTAWGAEELSFLVNRSHVV